MLSFKDIQKHGVRLKRLTLENFRGFRNLEIDFAESERAAVLIANNGSGKTSVLDAIAEFLRYFLWSGILPKSGVFESELTHKDIFNETTNSTGGVTLELTYPFPSVEIFTLILSITTFLDEQSVEGDSAKLGISSEAGHEEWVLHVKRNEGKEEFEFDVFLPLELQEQLEEIGSESSLKLINGEDNFLIAKWDGNAWQPNLELKAAELQNPKIHRGICTIKFENQSGKPTFTVPTRESLSIESLIQALENQEAFIEDFKKSALTQEESKKHPISLPLLTYYGGGAINTKFDSIDIRYEPRANQAYCHALSPERFDFKEFFEWFHALQEEPNYLRYLVCNGILEMLNADQPIYEGLFIEKGILKIYKRTTEQGTALPIEIGQLSAGEKNLFALIGDLIKRAIQLDPAAIDAEYNPDDYTDIDPQTYNAKDKLRFSYIHGIVLIDEIDLHLHPKWQRVVMPMLMSMFPEVQFVVTTHSPFVLQAVAPRHRIRLANDSVNYFKDEPTTDYEAVMIDYFLIFDFFDVETENILKIFRQYLGEVARKERGAKDPEFIQIIKTLSARGEVIKRVIAIELAQLNQ
jgi:predicted ATP-binding protein involved in virulence